MKVKSISLARLAEELNCSVSQIRDVIRGRKLNVALREDTVNRETANQIARIQRGSINWDQIEREEKRKTYDVAWQQMPADSQQIERWFKKIRPIPKPIDSNRDCLLGTVFTGGFFGESETEFALSLDPGVNILIGERGTGKSTALQLLSLLSDSISEETEILVDKLTRLIKTADTCADITDRIRETLRKYEIDSYACFYVKDTKLFCYYVNIADAFHDILARDGDSWTSVEFKEIIRPRMQVLQQGEVTRIGDERTYDYLNNILDPIYPTLKTCRLALGSQIGAFGKQSDAYRKSNVQFNTQRIETFVLDRYRELHQIHEDIRRGVISDESVELVSGYLRRIGAVDRHRLPVSIFELLQGDEDAYYQLFLGRVVPFLRELVDQIERLKKRESQYLAREFDGKLEVLDDPPGFQNSAEMLELDADREALAEIDRGGSRDLDDLRADGLLFQQVLGREVENPITRKQLRVGRQILDLLYVRLRVLRTWLKLFSRPRAQWTPQLSALIRSMVQLLELRIDLLKEQAGTCRTITNALTGGDLDINIFTMEHNDTLLRHQLDIEALQSLSSLYERLLTMPPSARLNDVRATAIRCDEYLERFDELRATALDAITTNMHPFIFIPIEVQLRHGGAFRNFRQLSFGQKSGIILDMVLFTTEDGIVVLDQPEDNLDAAAVSTLIPTLNNLAEKRQVIIATHNSSLVLGLNATNVVVLETTGAGGTIKTSGPPQAVVEEMLEILEGGKETFERKMLAYEEFINRLSASIEDMDLSLIESSFRQRMMDRLRKIVEPIMDDESRLRILKHELRGILDPMTLDASSRSSDRTAEDVLRDIDRLGKQLDVNIKRMMTAINDLNVMDTKPDLKSVDLYVLLEDMASDYLQGIGRNRRIQIDLDEKFKRHFVFADAAHLRLVFRNLFNNSFRSTEAKRVELSAGADFVETIKIQLASSEKNDRLTLLFMDNGRGLRPQMRGRLYVERCSDRDSNLHGMGGVIIRKMLDLNHGKIEILPPTADFAMVQSITLISAEAAMAFHAP